jgi:3-phenylpropionate/trans-cinnamate dioxygenase ferredoxin subunit
LSKHVVAKVSDLPPGTRRLVTVRGRPIVIFNVNGKMLGMLNRCPHQGGSLCHGIVTGLVEGKRAGDFHLSRAGEIVRCPWHGWEFDIRTGQSYCDPETIRTRTYDVSIETGTGVVQGPYVAETVPVTVEEQYVVVEV